MTTFYGPGGFMLGQPVIYRALEAHHNTTIKGATELQGSVHHPSQRVFAGVVGAVNADGTASVQLHVPNAPPTWVDNVTAGDGHGQAQEVGAYHYGADQTGDLVANPDEEALQREKNAVQDAAPAPGLVSQPRAPMSGAQALEKQGIRRDVPDQPRGGGVAGAKDGVL